LKRREKFDFSRRNFGARFEGLRDVTGAKPNTLCPTGKSLFAVIASVSEAIQNSAAAKVWIASSLRFSQ
jgi:hypothetical protein